MPLPAGALLSFHARGRIGGHRRGWHPPVTYRVFDMPVIGALVPGVLSTGLKPPEVPYAGATFTGTRVLARVTAPPQLTDVILEVRRNGSLLAEVTIEKSKDDGSVIIAQAISDGDYFDVEITQVGTTPNEGSDLVWIISGPSAF